MNLHYSKTDYDCYISKLGFYYPMNLHYSKTSKRYSKLLPVHVSQGIQLHFIISLPFFQKNILSAMLVQICSTTLQFCTSSAPQRDIWSLLPAQNARKYTTPKLWDGYWRITSVLLPYEFTLLQNYDRVAAMYVSVLLPYEFTLLQNYCSTFCGYVRFYYPMNLHYSKTSKEVSEAATSVCITGH